MSFDLKSIDGRFAPALPRAEYLPQGNYVMKVLGASFESGEDCAFLDVVLEAELPKELAGNKYEWIVFVSDDRTASIAGQNLRAMGVDVDAWQAFSQDFPQVARHVRGMRFLAQKRLVVKQSGRVHHRLIPVRPLKEGEQIDPSNA